MFVKSPFTDCAATSGQEKHKLLKPILHEELGTTGDREIIIQVKGFSSIKHVLFTSFDGFSINVFVQI